MTLKNAPKKAEVEEKFTPQPLTALVPARKTTAAEIVSWEEQLAQEAAIQSQIERASGGTFFGTSGGILSWQNEPIHNNEMIVIILDSMLENSYRENTVYDRNKPTNPDCYALGYAEKTLVPHEVVREAGLAQHETCAGCPKNEWASASNGSKGKACKNGRRIATIPGGRFARDGSVEYYTDEGDFSESLIGYLKLPPTSVKNKGFKAYSVVAKEINDIARRPLWSVYMKVKIVPDKTDQFHIVFTPLGAVPNPLLPILKQRVDDAAPLTGFPYALNPRSADEGQTEAASPVTESKPVKTRKY